MKERVIIIGAGVAGLIAAQRCEEAGIAPLLIEASDRVGGRLRTDKKDGFLLDQGFQVMLTAYEETKRYLDYDALKLKYFKTGAIINHEGRTFSIADPLREPSRLLGMITSPVGTFRDKWLIFKLTQQLKRTSSLELFKEDDPGTIEYLEAYGFSKKIIHQFFKPFFGGIFLENELRTSAGMFKFVFKKFSEGLAALPEKGIEAIPAMLADKLTQTEMRFNSRVIQVSNDQLTMEDGSKIGYEKLIITIDPSKLMDNLADQNVEYLDTTNLYFSTDYSILDSKAIALVADSEKAINNYCVLTDVAPSYSSNGKSLISVTLKEGLGSTKENHDIAMELKKLTGCAQTPEFVARYHIREALPIVDFMRYDEQFTTFGLTNKIFLAGDHLLNGSLDAAMRSGRKAAEAMLVALKS